MKQTRDRLWSDVWSEVYAKIDATTAYSYIHTNTKALLRDQVWNTIGERLRDQIRDPLYHHIINHIKENYG